MRRDSCFTGVSSWSPEKAAGFLGGSSRTGLAEGSWDRRTPDSLAEGLSSDTEGTTQDTQETLHKCSAGGLAGTHRTGTRVATRQRTDCSGWSWTRGELEGGRRNPTKHGSREAEAGEREAGAPGGRERKEACSQDHPKAGHFGFVICNSSSAGALGCDSPPMAGVMDRDEEPPLTP